MLKKIVFIVFSLLILTSLTSLVTAQEKAKGDVETAVNEYFGFFHGGDWASAATKMHPSALIEFKNIFTDIFDNLPAGQNKSQGLQMLFQLDSTSQLHAMDPTRAFVTFMSSMATINPMMLEMMTSMKVEFVGSVPEGEDVRHCVIRTSMNTQGNDFSAMEVATFKKHEGEWRALLTGDLKNIGQMFRQTGP